MPPGTDGNFVSDLSAVGVCRTGSPSSELRMLKEDAGEDGAVQEQLLLIHFC